MAALHAQLYEMSIEADYIASTTKALRLEWERWVISLK